MKFYFSPRQIPQLQGLPLTKRLNKLQQASTKLTTPEKTLLNLLKLLVIVPLFIAIMRSSQDWTALIWALLLFLLYPLLIKPIQYTLCVKYLEQSE